MTKISNKDTALAINLALKGKKGAEYKKTLESVVHFLSRRRLWPQTAQILYHLQKIEDRESGILRMKLLSARPIGTHIKHNLKRILEKRHRVKDVIFEEVSRQEFLGGVRLETEDEIIDLTLKNKINKMKEYLSA